MNGILLGLGVMLLSVGHCGRLSTFEVAAQEQEEREEAEEECVENDADACALLSRHYHTGYGGLTRDDAAAVRLASGACDAGSFLGCTWLGFFFHKGHGVEQDYQAARRLYERSCAGDDPRGCNNLGALYRQGEGVTRDDARARALFERACDGGLPSGCQNLATFGTRE